MKENQRSSFCRCLFFIFLAVFLTLFSLNEAQARMGGGHSYSGGSSGGSSSRSSGGGSSSRSSGGSSWGGGSSSRSSGGAWGGSSNYGYSTPPRSGYGIPSYNSNPVYYSDSQPTTLVEIVFLIIVIYILLRLLSQRSYSGKENAIRAKQPEILDRLNIDLDNKIQTLKEHDPNFSKVLFIDFVCLLYHKFYSFRGTDKFSLLMPFISKVIVDQTSHNVFYRQQSIRDIVIGKAKIINIMDWERTNNILIEFESNLTLHDLKTKEKVRLINREAWLFGRKAGLLSPQPEQMRTLSCPSCGAPADFTDAGECQYCHSFIQAGEQQWQVVKIDIIDSQQFQTEDPGGYVEEVGTDFPTYIQAGLKIYENEFLQKHELSDWYSFFTQFSEQVVKPYFLATYAAWSKGEWNKARHLVSDRLYESNGFWMDEYARLGWQNSLENINIQMIEISRIDLDKFYDSLTVRVFASCLDYTIDKRGQVIGGSIKKPRQFSEYWTFIRTAGVKKIDNEYDLKSCPSCGAPADKVGQTGVCGYCGSKITEGHFSWVLAVITQDEVYEG